MKKIEDAVILANGNYPSHTIPLKILNDASFIVCCDGASDNFIQKGKTPQAIVGDCDSISEENKKKFASILHPNPDQNSNDLTKAVNYCIQEGIQKITILGATGLREDHTIANISLLIDYCKKVEVQLVSDYGIFMPIQKTTTFKSVKGQQISIFNMENKPITTENLKYPIEDRKLPFWWQGTLNEALEDNFTIHTTGKVLIYRVFNEN